MPDIANSVSIDKRQILVNGEPFPYLVANEPITVTYDGSICLVNLTILADAVDIDPAEVA